MYFGKMNFDTVPDIGFAISHHSREYKTTYGRTRKMSVEIAYITSGRVKISLYGNDMYADEGCVIVIFRHLPISTCTVGEGVHSHYTVLAEFEDYDFTLLEQYEDSVNALTIPFVIRPCAQADGIGNALCRISAELAEDRTKYSLKASIAFLSLLSEASDIAMAQNMQGSKANRSIVRCVYDYVEDNIEKSISLSDIAGYVCKSPNHISYAFKSEAGMTVKEYINIQKVKKIAALMQNEGIEFALACESVAISDITYGYRLFKRFMGVTPKRYMAIKMIQR